VRASICNQATLGIVKNKKAKTGLPPKKGRFGEGRRAKNERSICCLFVTMNWSFRPKKSKRHTRGKKSKVPDRGTGRKKRNWANIPPHSKGVEGGNLDLRNPGVVSKSTKQRVCKRTIWSSIEIDSHNGKRTRAPGKKMRLLEGGGKEREIRASLAAKSRSESHL